MVFTPHHALRAAPSLNARFFVCAENAVLLRREGAGVELLPRAGEVEHFGLTLDDCQMVGALDGEDALALPWPRERRVPDGFDLVGLRTLWSRLDEVLFGIAGRANALAHFASTHRFCGRCGAPTARAATERAVVCPKCQLTSYPRISPAIITLVRRGDEALLARSGRFPVPMFSTLAGFSEVGESLEQTLVREVREEVGVTVANVRYFGSQPWPFPHSLMVGFTADWVDGDIIVDGTEIAEARFFRATELPLIPPRLSIARALIEAWVKEVTGTPSTAP